MKNKLIIALLGILFFSQACDDSILDKTNPNQLTVDQYYTNADELTAATNAIYGQFTGSDLWGRMMQYFSDTRADEHSTGGPQLETRNAQLLTGTYDNSNYTIIAAYRGLYRLIHRANAVIEFGPNIEDIDSDLRAHRIAEAKFLRAWAYYYLTVNWGRVPIYTETVKSPDGYQPLAEESEIFNLLETDLTDIQSVLKVTHSSEDRGRATKGAAQLLLARVLMHQGKYSEARTVLLDIYENGPYRLMDNYSDNFREETSYNDESIFEIGFTGTGFNWWEDGNGDGPNDKQNVMFQDYSPVAWRNMIPSDKLINAFEHPENGDDKEDPRLRESVIFVGDMFGPPENPIELTAERVGGYTSNFHGEDVLLGWFKYSPMYKIDPGEYYTSSINYRNMRFAEVLIKLAECENELDNIPEALGYLNEIRSRPSVDMPDYPTARFPSNTKVEVRRTIMHESLVEFSNEKLRPLELARWRRNGHFDETNPDPVAYIRNNPARALLPLPDTEVSRNNLIN
ncbi:RagB/SusD family nutrient uptake outer membrane protein [Natronoflexus pectinivorans]|uniref:Putative outer membrane starch-binding protein n=1 Tax=Natronoflexus pectinivorans TaxID=682526 RepID=A0A4R2GN66_9BACT|nr:RagB/SusD family nutrient uptake outer membrane protein [Natronoflexus pectinivorans]TCO10693.1 putative outer membrane starch-binding protein [Natronoflexus pectinivorans]